MEAMVTSRAPGILRGTQAERGTLPKNPQLGQWMIMTIALAHRMSRNGWFRVKQGSQSSLITKQGVLKNSGKVAKRAEDGRETERWRGRQVSAARDRVDRADGPGGA